MSAREQHLRVAKTARYYVLGEPGESTAEVWICCHGYGQLAARFSRPFESIAGPERVIVLPEALHRFYLDAVNRPAADRRVGATWMTREDRAADISDYVGYLDTLCAQVLSGVPPASRLIGFGFSQGVATITRWAVATRLPVTRLILWGAGLPPDLEWTVAAARLQRLRVTLVAGVFDTQMPLEGWVEQERVLAEHGVEYERIEFTGGHYVEPAALERLVAD